MANCINYNCNDVLDTHVPVDCGDYPLGGISAAIILACNHQLLDPSNGTQVNAEIAAGRAWLVENIKVSIAEPSAVLVPNPVACRQDRLINYDRTGTWQDGNVNEDNVSWYTTLFSGQSFGGVIFRECAESRITFIDDEVTWTGGRLVPDSDNENQLFNGSFAWRSKVEPDIYAEPAGVFTA